MSAYLENASDRTRMVVSLALCFAVAMIVAVVVTLLTLAADVRTCHTEGGHYTMAGTTGTCSWAPPAGGVQ